MKTEGGRQYQSVYEAALRESLDWLCDNRKNFAVLYLALIAVCFALVLYGARTILIVMFMILPEPVLVLPESTHLSESATPLEAMLYNSFGLSYRLGLIATFCALQAVFLFGGGRVRVRPELGGLFRTIISLITSATFMALISVSFAFSYFEMTGRFEAPDSHPFGHAVSLSIVVLSIFWIAVGAATSRKIDYRHTLSRFTICLLAGSWIGFAIALPIELVACHRHIEEPTESGSWWALVICVPILIWSIGPAIYLLFLRDKTQCQSELRHSTHAT